MSNEKEYWLFFDTNVLFQLYDKKADFNSFSFNSTFENVCDMLSQLDIYERVSVGIPKVVWNEMTQQIIEAHATRVLEFGSYIKKWKFPEFRVATCDIEDYPNYIKSVVERYKEELEKGLIKITELSLPSASRFQSVMERAFSKLPPFGGKEKNSDKGFKDVLIWESILEFTAQHENANIIFYTKDKGYKDVLVDEFEKLYPNASIAILSAENEIKPVLEEWAKSIDEYSYQPIGEENDVDPFAEWVESPNFVVQLIDHDYGLIPQSALVAETIFKLVDYEMPTLLDSKDQNIKYSMPATLDITYILKDCTTIQKVALVNIIVCKTSEDEYAIESIQVKNPPDVEATA